MESSDIKKASVVADDVVADSFLRSDRIETLKSMTTTAVVLGATLIVLSVLHPDLILRNNTPTGGDMGAHVWGPAYLRDVLIPHFRLTGWSMDWYSGLPAYRFYMVFPALLIVLLDVVLPYGVAFKIIAVLGLVTFPLCAYLMGKIAKLAYPFPELMTLGATMFLFDESFTIYGGNIASTMAGEFSHSIALALSLVGLGLFARGLEDGKHRGWAAVLIALSALSHGIVLIFVFGGALVMMLMRRDREHLKFGLSTLVVASLLSAFWVVPFLGGHSFMTDMKYGPEPGGGSFSSMWDMYFPLSTGWDLLLMILAVAGFAGSWSKKRFLGMWMGVYLAVLFVGVKVAQNGLPVIGLLWNPRVLPFLYLLRYMLAGIGVYEVLLYIRRSVMLQRSPGEVPPAPNLEDLTRIVWVMGLVCLVVLGARYHKLPLASLKTTSTGTSYTWGPFNLPSQRAFSDGWARWNFEGYEGKPAYPEYRDVVAQMKKLGQDPSHGCGRAVWENNSDLNKYGTTMALMLLPYWTDGCIGSMEGLYFEASGTTPYHFLLAAAVSKQSSNPVRELRYVNNDAAIGVAHMRSLGVRYFMAYTPEAIAQAATQPSLKEVATSGPWKIYEIADTSLVTPLKYQPVVVNGRPGDRRERWLEVGSSYFQQPDDWDALPVDRGPQDWQRINVEVDAAQSVGVPGGPGRQVDIVRPSTQSAITQVELPAVTISNVSLGRESISFSVDKVGVPVLVKVSYFPNWKVKGASHISRAAPNMMVVTPTQQNVSLSYEPSSTDNFAYVLTFVGIVWVIFFFRRRFRYGTAMPPQLNDESIGDADVSSEVGTDGGKVEST